MGRAKAWLPWFGRTMVEHVVAQLEPLVGEVVVVTSEDLDLPPLSARVVRDREPGRGPLAGLRDGLGATRADQVFVTSTDAPFLTSAFVERLFGEGGACAPVSEGFVQVLCAVYPGGAGERAAELLERGRRRPLDLLEATGFTALEEADLRATFVASGGPAPWHGFNTPDAYLGAVRAVDPKASASVELLGRAALSAGETLREVPVGTLGEILAGWSETRDLVGSDGRLARSYLASLGGRALVRDLSVPVGPGERVTILDAQAGG